MSSYYKPIDYIVPALFTASMFSGIAFLIALANYAEAQEKAWKAEFKLKYNDKPLQTHTEKLNNERTTAYVNARL